MHSLWKTCSSFQVSWATKSSSSNSTKQIVHFSVKISSGWYLVMLNEIPLGVCSPSLKTSATCMLGSMIITFNFSGEIKFRIKTFGNFTYAETVRHDLFYCASVFQQVLNTSNRPTMETSENEMWIMSIER